MQPIVTRKGVGERKEDVTTCLLKKKGGDQKVKIKREGEGGREDVDGNDYCCRKAVIVHNKLLLATV